jgi:hypothetical protein
MSSKEERSVEQVARLLSLLGLGAARIHPDRPPCPDVFAQVDTRRIAIETTDFHGDETSHGGSAIRRNEQSDAVAGRVRTYSAPTDPLNGLVRRIQAKVSKRYKLSATDEAWLAVFAGVPQVGAAASTFLVTAFLNCQQLTVRTSNLLEASVFRRSYILCELTETGQPRLYSWEKGRAWTEVTITGEVTPGPLSTFWSIQKFFRKS